MPEQRKRKASACLESTEMGRPVRKSARLALTKRQKDITHGHGEGSGSGQREGRQPGQGEGCQPGQREGRQPGQGEGSQTGASVSQGVPIKFPWASLPFELQEPILSNLTVRETAVFAYAVQCRNVRAIHRDMMQKRHDALVDILRQTFGRSAARLLPPLDIAKPVDVYIDSQVPPHLQLRPYRPARKGRAITVEAGLLGVIEMPWRLYTIYGPEGPLLCGRMVGVGKMGRD